MEFTEWLTLTYLAIGAAIPLVKVMTNPQKLLDEPEVRYFSGLFGSAPTALLISVAALLSIAVSAFFWPIIIIVRYMRSRQR